VPQDQFIKFMNETLEGAGLKEKEEEGVIECYDYQAEAETVYVKVRMTNLS